MAEGAQQAELTILRRILAYARKVLRWEGHLDGVRDDRQQPRIPTATIVRSVVVMFLARLGSLNALEQSAPSRLWRNWLRGAMPLLFYTSRGRRGEGKSGPMECGASLSSEALAKEDGTALAWWHRLSSLCSLARPGNAALPS